jgi:hypothetical protein
MLKKSLFIAGILIVQSLLASCVVVPHQPDSRPPVDEVGQCLKENRKRHDEVQQMFRRAASGGRISDSEAARFQSLERRLDDIRYNLYRDGITLSDCQRLGREIAVERANVQRMTATPVRNPQIDYCRQDNRRDHEDVWQLFLRAKSAGRISKDEARHFKDMEHRLGDIKRRLSFEGLSLSECQAINSEIGRERDAVRRMTDSERRY